MSNDEVPAEAQLLERLRNEQRPALSVRKAATAAGISEGRWRSIVKGRHQVTKGTAVPTRAPAETLARMAKVVGGTPDDLRAVDRDDAADELERMMTVREMVSYERAGGTLRAPPSTGLGAALKRLIPDEPERDAEAEESSLQSEEAMAAQTWGQAHALVDAVIALDDAPEALREATRRIIFTLSAVVIIRILQGRHAPQMEQWLNRVYVEREQLYRAVTVGEPKFPWYGPTQTVKFDEEGMHYVVEEQTESDASSAGNKDQEDRPPTREELDLAARTEEDPKEDEARDDS